MTRSTNPTVGSQWSPGLALSLALAIALAIELAATPARPQATCKHFPEVKAAIDHVIDKDAAKGALFRKEFKDGMDSIHIIEQMVDDDMRKKIDLCRYDVAEHLTRRGFPPPH